MKRIIFFITVSLLITTSCKSTKGASASTAVVTQTSSGSGATTGKVSHQYKSTGCETVVVVTSGEESITLIPKDKLSKAFDVDGLEIKFNYRPLKMPNPAGCTMGMPAELTDISKK